MRISILIITIFFCVACTSYPSIPVPNVESSLTSFVATETLTLHPPETITKSPQPTLTSTLEPTVTWTPLPMLSSQEAQARIIDLQENNGNCELPCWWGIVPGKTAWAEALHFLTPLIFDLYQSEPYARVENGKRHINIGVEFYYPLPNNKPPVRVSVLVKDNIVSWITIFPQGVDYSFQLHQILSILGMPKQILISAQSSAPFPVLPPTIILLDYSDIGIWVSYGYIPKESGENLLICPKPYFENESIYDNVGGKLELFIPESGVTPSASVEEYAEILSGFPAQKIEDVTNMDIETFYNTFIVPQSSNCLETPANLWP